MNRRAWIFVAIVGFVVAFDQSGKAWARTLPAGPPGCAVPACHGIRQPVVAGFWDWELAYNPGAAFSTFVGQGNAQLVLGLIAVIAIVGVGVVALRARPDQRLRRAGFGLIAGGALGNLIDRVRDGAVTDFVRWHVGGHMWPIFNVADAALIVGVALIVVDEKLKSRRAAEGRTLVS